MMLNLILPLGFEISWKALWDSTLLLSLSNKIYVQILIVVFWVVWNNRNRSIFDNAAAVNFHSLVIKVFSLFHT